MFSMSWMILEEKDTEKCKKSLWEKYAWSINFLKVQMLVNLDTKFESYSIFCLKINLER